MATTLRNGQSGARFSGEITGLYFLQIRPDLPWDPPTLLLNGCLTYSDLDTKLANEEDKNYKVSRGAEGQIFLELLLVDRVYCCSCLVCIVVSCLVCIVVSCLVCIVVSCLVCVVVSCLVCIVVVLCVLLLVVLCVLL